MTPILDYAGYNEKMNKSMFDKLFFLSHVDADIFVDFGCADGAMIKQMSKMFPEHLYIGYDTDPEMVERAYWLNETQRNAFLSNWEEVLCIIRDFNTISNKDKKSCLILSSVIHEVFSYGAEDDILEFYERIFGFGFNYIAIRDMALRPFGLSHYPSPDKLSNLLEKFDKQQVKDFEKVWGKFDALDMRKYIHFLLKYKYKNNWQREVKENYFSYNVDNLIKVAYDYGYVINYREHFSVPFIRRQIEEDFGFVMEEPTHYKLILENKKND